MSNDSPEHEDGQKHKNSVKLAISQWLANNVSEDSIFHGVCQRVYEKNLISLRQQNHAAAEGFDNGF